MTNILYAVQKTAFLKDRSWLSSFQHLYVRPAFYDFQKFVYADILALLHSSKKKLEGLGEEFEQDMTTLSVYLQTWRLKLSHTKTVTAAFHLNNQKAKREQKVYNNNRLLPFWTTPYLLG